MTDNIRNFCLIAHIDHGKSTLADRLLEFTGTVDKLKSPQVLDQLELEREHGVTIKASCVRMAYHSSKSHQTYILNLIDTPGHVDFGYEVSRSLAACEGALLIIDASQGVEAQTIANAQLAKAHNLKIIPVLNKIDLPTADIDKTQAELQEILGIDADAALLVSAKEGFGIDDVLEAIVERIPPPKGVSGAAAFRALIIDAHYDRYRGVVCYVRVFDGEVSAGMRILSMVSLRKFEVAEVGVFTPEMKPKEVLSCGEVGYIIANIKDIKEAKVGDTFTDAHNPAKEPLPGYKPAKPMVFCGFYPAEQTTYEQLKDAMERLQLNDAAFLYEQESSSHLGAGFRCGFLGLFHLQIIQERLEREFGLEIIATAPAVVYRAIMVDGKIIEVDTPAKLPVEVHKIRCLQEPWVAATIVVPVEYLSACFELAEGRRGVFKKIEYPSTNRAVVYFELPLAEILLEFFDQLKSLTRGYASLDYEPIGFRESDLVKVNLLINSKPVEALSFITHRSKAYSRGKTIIERLRELIPRQLFEVRLQAAIGNKIIASASIPAIKKDVLAKCYGGDVTRKRKLLEKQKAGKRRLRKIGQVELPQEAFLSVLKVG